MYSWTPKISWTTRATGGEAAASGAAKYAAISPSSAGIDAIPVTSPVASVWMALARTGFAAIA
jgi:hypothetical protein